MMISSRFNWTVACLAALALAAAGCGEGGGAGADGGPDSGPDGDAGADTDIDSDTDSDTDSDAGALPDCVWTTSESPASYVVGAGVWSMVVEDFDGDGILDLAITIGIGSADDGVMLLLGEGAGGAGDGTFSDPMAIETGGIGGAIAAADFDDDGVVDLVVCSSDTVSILLGAGDGAFTDPVPYAIAAVSKGIAVVDVDADGVEDILTVNGHSAYVLFGNGADGIGDGTFSGAPGTTEYAPVADFAAADFNGDDVFDVAIMKDDGDYAQVLLGNGAAGVGDGTFGESAGYLVGRNAGDLEAADFDGDGDVDLAGSSVMDHEIGLILGNGDGTFADRVIYPTGEPPTALTAADLNGDGTVDLATANDGEFSSDEGGAGVLFGMGEGALSAATTFHFGTGSRDIAAGDFDEDGVLDLAVLHSETDVAILLGALVGSCD